jgi:hypothetical protein
MCPIRIEEIKDLTTYERVRPEMRKRVIALRDVRRVMLGQKVSIVFENRETILYQIQEMLRAERIVEESAIQHEIDTFNELLPKPDRLVGTLFIELVDPDKIREELEQFVGLDRDEHVWFDLGDGGRIPARFAQGQSDEARIPSVHHVQFTFTPEAAAVFRTLTATVRLVVDHPRYKASAPVEGPTRHSLAEDLGGT